MRWHKKRLVLSLSEYFDTTETEKHLDTMIERANQKRIAAIVDKQKESFNEGYATGFREAETRLIGCD
jgi:TFIIF-interacting CTD phosphatase-like protein